jgi:hypothetical protein
LEQLLRTDLVFRGLIHRGQPPLLEITHELVQRIRHRDEEVVGPQIYAHRIVPFLRRLQRSLARRGGDQLWASIAGSLRSQQKGLYTGVAGYAFVFA